MREPRLTYNKNAREIWRHAINSKLYVQSAMRVTYPRQNHTCIVYVRQRIRAWLRILELTLLSTARIRTFVRLLYL